jgi:hypothetical protein
MKAILVFTGWLILMVLCWPVAILALVLWPLVLLISIPLSIIGIGVGAALALLKALLYLPARILGQRA